jgi:hypothetical protein
MSDIVRAVSMFLALVASPLGCRRAETPTDERRVRVEPVSQRPAEGAPRSPETTLTLVVDDAEWQLLRAVRVVGEPGADPRVLIEFQVKNQASSQQRMLLLPRLVTRDGSQVSPLPEDDATAPVASTLESSPLSPNAIKRQWLAYPLANGVRFTAVRFPSLAPGLTFIDAPWRCVPCSDSPPPNRAVRSRRRRAHRG